MDIKVGDGGFKVAKLTGDAIVIDEKGNARDLKVGDVVTNKDTVIVVNGAEVELKSGNEVAVITQNCVACFDHHAAPQQIIADAPVSGKINVDLSNIEDTTFAIDEIEALQAAILAGEDPTAILEAAAAGGVLGSANAGFVTIDYTNAQTLAQTFFETSAPPRDVFDDPEEDGRSTVFAAGGEGIAELVVEGDLDPDTYPSIVTASVLIEAGDLPLDPTSFVPDPISLATLLAELNNDIKSANQDVTFSYDANENAIIGVSAAGEVIRIDLDVTPIGKDLTLTITTTLSQPIDHLPSVGGGNVALVNDQIVVNFDITGTDSGGNLIQAPISASVTIGDGIDPQIVDVPNITLNEANLTDGTATDPSATVAGNVVEINLGSDTIEQYRLDIANFNADGGLTSQGEPLAINEVANSDGSFTYTASTSAGDVFVLTINTAGDYEFSLKQPIDHQVGSDSTTIDFPLTATDYDDDTAQGTLPITILDDKPVLNGFTGETSVDEDDIPTIGSALDGSNQIRGNFDIGEGADGIKSYQITNVDTLLFGLTSGELALEWKSGSPEQSGTEFTYTAQTTAGDTVFTLVFDTSDNSYRFTLDKPLDHPDVQGENIITLNVMISATDFDNDTTAAKSLDIVVVDDIPLINEIAPLSIDEDDLPGGIDAGNDPLIDSGVFDTTQGADRVVTYSLESLTVPVSGLESQGKAITIAESYDPNTQTYTYTGSTDDGEVFILTLSGTGAYQFELKAPIDHAVSEDDKDLTFAIVATDQDGDTSTKPLVVKLVDDAPILNGFTGTTTVDEDDIPAIGSALDGSNVIGGTIDVEEGADGVKSYQVTNTATLLNGLTSGDEALEWKAGSPEQDSGKFTYTAQTPSGATVFTLVFDTSNNSYQFILLKPLDHADAQGENNLELAFQVSATDFDNDTTGEQPLTITVVDDIPLINTIAPLSVDEDDLVGGTDEGNDSLTASGVFDTTQGADGVVTYQLESLTSPVSGLLSQGKPVTISESFDTVTKTYTYTGETADGPVFVLTLSGNGNYQFELKAPIDHPDSESNQDLTFSIVATDQDGDTSTKPLVVTLEDDAPILNGFSGQTSVDEDDIPTIGSDIGPGQVGSNIIGGTVDISEGADGVKSYQVTNIGTLLNGLSSGDDTLEWKAGSPEQVGTQFTYTAQTTSGETVFSLVFDTSDNSYSFTLDKPLNHVDAQGQNTLELTFEVTATDFDNDTTAAKPLVITVVDDVPQIDTIAPLSVDEDDLANGTDAGSDSLIDTGVFDTTQGADQVITYHLESLTVPVSGLMSQGKEVSINESFDSATKTYTYTGSSDDGDVFVLTLKGDGNYQFELKAPIDHAENEDDKDLTFSIVATDRDGDTSIKPLVVKLVDDAPILNGFTGETSVDEDDIPTIGSALDGSNEISGNFDIDAGADGLKSFQVTNIDSVLTGLKSGTEAVEWQAGSPVQNGTQFTYTAQTTSGAIVFTLVLDTSDNSYHFTLSEPLDHPTAQGENSLALDFMLSATDFDGDTTAAKPLTITVVDDIPLINTILPLSVDEDDLVGGSDQGNDSLKDSGVFDVTQGADQVITYHLASLTDPVAGLQSQGKAITISEVFDQATQTYTYTGSTENGEVFILTLNGNAGSYEFELKAPIDHADTEDDKDITFSVVATDQDGDTSTKPLIVNLVDDAPEINSFTGDQIVNEDDIAIVGSDPDKEPITIGGTFDITEGADALKAITIANEASVLNGLKSGGENLEWATTTTVGDVITYTAQTETGNEAVFTMVFNTQTQRYDFTLLKALDHPTGQGENQLDINFQISVIDFDNDESSAIALPITVIDDVPTVEGVERLKVNENDLSDGSSPSATDLTVDGSFTTVQGADSVVKYSLESTTSPVTGLQSGGIDVAMSGPVIDPTTNQHTYTGSAGGVEVFVLTLKANGDYSFELKAPIDHAQGSDLTTLTFPVIATDFDGDTSAKSILVDISDDLPTMTEISGNKLVDEDDLARIGSDGNKESTTTAGNFIVEEGADGITEYEIVNLDSALDGLKSDEQDLVWAAVQTDGTKVTHTAQTATDGDTVFTLIFDTADNSYAFTIEQPFDHPAGQGQNDITIGFDIRGLDFDKDPTATLPLDIVVRDDIPTINNRTITVIEGETNSTRTNLFGKPGADGAEITLVEGNDTPNGEIRFLLADGTYVDALDPAGARTTVTVVETIRDSGGTITDNIVQGTLQVRPTSGDRGQFRFTPVDNLEHESGQFTFSMTVTATDGDQDTSVKTYTVNILDRDATIESSSVVSFEDSGRDSSLTFNPPITNSNVEDNQGSLAITPSKVDLTVKLFDLDNDEKVGTIIIEAGTHNGKFYFLDGTTYTELTTQPDGRVVLNADDVQQTIDPTTTIASIDNLYFVPDRNYSSGDGGFSVPITVEILNGVTPDHAIGGNLNIEVEAVADIAEWNDANSLYTYSLFEDGENANLALQAVTQDGSNPETITYRLEVTAGQGKFELLDGNDQVINEVSPGVYEITSGDINSVQVNPIDHFSGFIKFNATALTEETDNALAGKEQAESVVQELVINVNPIADQGSFSVSRITIFEDNAKTQDTIDPETDHEAFTLNKVITLGSTDDIDTPDDDSEAQFVQLDNFKSEDGSVLVGYEVRWIGTGDNPIVELSPGVFEIPEAALPFVEIQPPLHSNKDFSFDVVGIVKDTATLADGSQVVDTKPMGAAKTVNVTVKGVADIPFLPDVPEEPATGGVLGTWYEYDPPSGLVGAQVTINESTEADISFAVLSGEEDDSVFDGSESLSVLLSNIPDGVELFDANGGAIDLVYVGQEGGKPIYQANITQENYQSGITIRPPKYSTDDITIDAKVVVTENDGHVREVNGVLKVNIEPVIEMGGATNSYSNTSAGNEDTFIRVPWTIETNGASPDSTATTNGRDYEFVTEITISGFPTIAGEGVDIRVDGNDVVIDGVLQSGFSNISYANGVLNITGLDQSSTPPKIFVRPGEDSSKDFTLTSVLKVKEIDEDDPSLTVEADVTGQLSIVVRPVVEPDGTLSIEDSNGNVVTSINDADDGNSNGRIDFTINDQNGDANIVKFQDLDPSSTEDVDQVVVRFAGFTGGIPDADLEAVMDQLIVFGAVNNGDGSWTILDEENFTISAPKGLTYPNAGAAENSIKVEFVAEVRDAGDEGEGSAPREVKTIVDLVFPSDVSTLTSEAAEVEEITAPTAIILGQEDNQFDVSSQLSNVIKLKAGTADGIADQVTIVIAQSDIPAEVSGLVISGGTYDFANEMYIFEAQVTAGGDLIIPAGWEFITPEDYAGDFIIPMSVVTTDTISGDENVLPVDVKFAVTPLVDVPVSSGGSPQPEDTDVTPSFTIDASSVEAGTGAELSADALEDNLIKLELDIALADERDAPTQGRETLSKVEIELVDSDLGFFADINGDPITTTTPGVLVIESSDPAVIEAALQAIYFVPKHNYPTGNNNNTVEVRVTGTVSDKTIFDQTGTTQTPDEQADKTFSAEMSFDITPVVDPVTMPEASDNIVVVGDEDTDIHLESNGSGLQISLTDTDGSEQFLSAKLTGVPDDFIVDSTSSDFVVKNNGGGEWTIQLTNPSVTSIDLSQVTITPAKNFSGKADINIVVFTQEQLLGVPVEHTGQFTIDVTPVGDPVDTDPVDSVTGDEGQNIDITINASVIDKIDLLPADSAQDQPETLLITVENVPAGGQIFFDDGITLATDLGGGVWQLEVNAQSIDKVVFNSGDQNQGTWDPDQLTIKVQSVDTGYDGVKHLGPISQFEVGVVVEAVNDRPYFEDINNLQTAEDTSVFVKGFTINDIDATLDDPNASYTLTLNIDSGTLAQDTTVASNNNLTVNITGGNTITISGTVSEINQALAQNLVSFTPAPDSNDLVDPDGVKVTATVDDNGNLGLVEPGNDNTLNQNSTEFVINVSEVNDKPIAADVDLGSINEDTSLQINVSQLIGPGLSTDPEGHNLIVKSISVPAEQGEITANPDGVSWTFTPKLDFSGDVTISYVIEDDGTTDGNPDFLTDQGTISVTVVGVNDAPEVDVTSATSTIDESAGQQISGITIADVDYVDAFANDPMSVELSVSYGSLSVNLPAGSTVTVTPASGSSITLEGTLAELNALLNLPATGEGVMLDASFATAAEIALTVSATDSGNPSGMSITTSKTHDITVNPVADAPTLSIQPGFDYIRNVSANLSVSGNGIAIVGLVAALTDVNEVLSVELSDLPAGASVETASGPITADGGIYSVPAADIDSIEIVGAGVGSHTVKVTAVSTDDGQTAQSAPIDIVLNISPDGVDIDQSAQTQDVELLGDNTGVNLTAGAGDDRIVGGDGGDILTGGAGNDEIIGGAGADTIDGGLGSDILTGGTGNDIFVWHEISDGATDTITDFTISEDKIDLRDVLPELKSATVGVDDLLAHIQVTVQNEDLAMTIHPDGVGSGEEQTILVENLAQDLTLGGLDQGQILNTLIDQNIFLHDS
ncbi:autotransporter adhesin [Vibrio sp. N418]|uniref:retention module-containing protein n=1 Tax=Vibrio sp. (strain N418) TaxID=701176 RepID=UPI00021C42A3|nr:retention module-containing protein [Vibrio sp. N418]EGU32930.1 autotransporter adhesin [Vibrio sp. N418]